MALFLAPLEQVGAEFGGVDVGEDGVHAVANAVHLVFEQRVAHKLCTGFALGIFLPSHEVHEYLVFRQRRGKHFPTGSKNIAARGGHLLVLFLKARAYGHPIFFVAKDKIGRTGDNGHPCHGEKEENDDVAGQNLFGREIHSSSILRLYKGSVGVCKVESSRFSSTLLRRVISFNWLLLVSAL